MEKLQISIDGNTKIIEADIKIAKGIYAVTESQAAKRNVQKLQIRFDETLPDNVLQNRVTKIQKWAFLTSMVADRYIQYIFMPSASQEDFGQFLKEIKDVKLKEMLTDTFNMTRLSIDNLDVLDKLNKSRN